MPRKYIRRGEKYKLCTTQDNSKAPKTTAPLFLKGRGKRVAAPIYIRLESKEMEDTKPKNRRGEDKKEKIKREEQKPTRPDQQDLSY